MSQSKADRVISTPYSEPAEHGVSCGASTDANEAYDRAKRHEAAIVDAAGKYEPKISENGIPSDVLDKLLPGDEIIELNEPIVAGGLIYRFAKRVFDVISCALIINFIRTLPTFIRTCMDECGNPIP